MAKKSIIERNYKRQILIKKYQDFRKKLLFLIKKTKSFPEKYFYYFQIQRLPKDSAPNRLRNRCWKTGRPRGYFRFFGLSRNAFRDMALNCFLPGVIKSSW